MLPTFTKAIPRLLQIFREDAIYAGCELLFIGYSHLLKLSAIMRL